MEDRNRRVANLALHTRFDAEKGITKKRLDKLPKRVLVSAIFRAEGRGLTAVEDVKILSKNRVVAQIVKRGIRDKRCYNAKDLRLGQ